MSFQMPGYYCRLLLAFSKSTTLRKFAIWHGADALDLDIVQHNHCIACSSPNDRKLDWVHMWIAMETYGKFLDESATRRELLVAFHDAVAKVLP